MYPINFKQAYEVPLGAGDNPNTGDLPFVVARDPRTPGPVMLVSCWKLTEEELAEVKATGCIYVAVMANPEYRTQPPIAVHGKSPFDIPAPNAYKVAPRTFREEQIDQVIEGATELAKEETNGQVKAQQSERPSDPEPGSQIFPESNGHEPARERRQYRNQAGEEIGPNDEVPSQDPVIVAKVREIVASGEDPFNSLELTEMGASEDEIIAVVRKIAEEGGKTK